MARSVGKDERLGFARGMVFAALTAYWSELRAKADWPLRELPPDAGVVSVSEPGKELASAIGTRAACSERPPRNRIGV